MKPSPRRQRVNALSVLLLSVALLAPPAAAQRYERQGKNEADVARDLRMKMLTQVGDPVFERAFGRYLTTSSGRTVGFGDALTWLKIGEALGAGSLAAARDEAAKWSISALAPLAGLHLEAVGALKTAADAKIADWVADLYLTPAYHAVGTLLTEAVVERARKDRVFIPSMWARGKEERYGMEYLVEQMRAVEDDLYWRWANEYQVELDLVQTKMAARLRQELGRNPTDRQLFNHFYAMTTRDMRGFLLANFQRITARQASRSIVEEVEIAFGSAMDELSEAERRTAWAEVSRGPSRPPPRIESPWPRPGGRQAPAATPERPQIDLGPHEVILDNGVPEWLVDDYERTMTYPTLPGWTAGWLTPAPSAEPPPTQPTIEVSVGGPRGSWGPPGPIPTSSQAGDIPTTADVARYDNGGFSEPFICGTRRKDGGVRLDGYPHGMAASAAFCAGGRGYGSVDACRKNTGCYTVELCGRVGRWDNPCVELGICCPAR